MYFLDKSLTTYFDPDFLKQFSVKASNIETKIDFVRFISLLSQFKKDGESSKIARGYKPFMEKYYEEYIYTVVGENASSLFISFDVLFPNKEYSASFLELKRSIEELEIPHQFSSIIDLDICFFGLIFFVVIQKKQLIFPEKRKYTHPLMPKY